MVDGQFFEVTVPESSKIFLRTTSINLPDDLVTRAKQAAKERGMSLTKFLEPTFTQALKLLLEAVDRQDAVARLKS